MVSDRLRQVFMTLLRQGLWGRVEAESSRFFPLTEEDWIRIHHISCKQTVQGVIVDGINQLPPYYLPPHHLLARWTMETQMLGKVNMQHTAVLEVLRHLHGQQPPQVFRLLKGLSVSRFYRNPAHRVAGDIDLWFGNESLTEHANQKAERLGYQVKRGRNGEASCVVSGVLVEHHSRLIELHNPFLQGLLRQWEQDVFHSTGDIYLPPVAHHLLLSTHILKHLVNEGVGLRQLCDAAVSLVALSRQTDGEELERISRRWHIYRWNRVLYALLVKHLGMPCQYLPFPTKANPDGLMDEVWESGNFGQGDERYGERPQGKWANKQYTLKRIIHKLNLSLGYAADETFWWLSGLCAVRIKELFIRK